MDLVRTSRGCGTVHPPFRTRVSSGVIGQTSPLHALSYSASVFGSLFRLMIHLGSQPQEFPSQVFVMLGQMKIVHFVRPGLRPNHLDHLPFSVADQSPIFGIRLSTRDHSSRDRRSVPVQRLICTPKARLTSVAEASRIAGKLPPNSFAILRLTRSPRLRVENVSHAPEAMPDSDSPEPSPFLTASPTAEPI